MSQSEIFTHGDFQTKCDLNKNMGEVLKFTPPEVSQEKQEIGHEVLDLLNEQVRIERELDELNRKYIAELPRLNDRIDAAQARASLAEKVSEQMEYLGHMEEALKELRAMEKAIEDKLVEKAILAYKLEQLRKRQDELGRPLPEVKTAAEQIEEKWFKAGERMSERVSFLAGLKEEAVDALEEDFFARGEQLERRYSKAA